MGWVKKKKKCQEIMNLTLAKMNQLSAFRYEGDYHPMDTLYDKKKLEELWKTRKAYWKVWK